MKTAKTYDKNSTIEEYEALYAMPVRTVIYIVRKDYETVMERIAENCPPNKEFKVTPINPGTDLFTIYGEGHSVVTVNRVTD